MKIFSTLTDAEQFAQEQANKTGLPMHVGTKQTPLTGKENHGQYLSFYYVANDDEQLPVGAIHLTDSCKVFQARPSPKPTNEKLDIWIVTLDPYLYDDGVILIAADNSFRAMTIADAVGALGIPAKLDGAYTTGEPRIIYTGKRPIFLPKEVDGNTQL